MAIDPRKLRPSDLCRLLNSTPLGEVINERQLYRHRMQAGLRIGNARYVDLLRYVGWLVESRHAPRPKPQGDHYEKLKQRARARNIALSLAGRDIGELPAVVNPARKERAATDFRFFCEAYFPRIFYLPWSTDHLKIIAKIEQAVLHGGLFAMATPRGFGKTSLCEAACLWAVLYGHREFVALIGSSEGHATNLLRDIKIQLETNSQLKEDFPEVCHPIVALDGITNRCKGQLYQGKRTFIEWTADRIVLPTIQGSAASGAILTVAGITGQIRGMSHQRPDGRIVRPSLVILDDPQTDESARSPSQCAAREATITGAVLGLGGPGNKIAAIMPCTVITPGDLADNFLNREKHPEWNGERLKLIYSFPTRKDLWAEYGKVLAEGYRSGQGMALATEFYQAHQAEMDEGAVVAWPVRFNHDELSAVQHAMNLLLQNVQAFWAEYQNEPKLDDQAERPPLQADEITARTNRLPRGTAPLQTRHITASIDVHQNLLYYCVVAWHEGFSGAVIDYGTWPPQPTTYTTLNNAPATLADRYPEMSLEAMVYAALNDLTAHILSREWEQETGGILRIERCLIDANWGRTTDIIYEFVRRSPHAAILLPSHGRFFGASSRPISESTPRPHEKVGQNWRLMCSSTRAIRYVIIDTNFWKSFVVSRLRTPLGEKGALTLFGDNPHRHRMLADHLCAEVAIPVTARGRTVEEWRVRPGYSDNHLFDCLVMAAVGASIQGISLMPQRPQTRISFSELQRQRRTHGGARNGPPTR